MQHPNLGEQAFLGRNQNSVPDLSRLGSAASDVNPITGHDPGQLTPTERNLCEAAAMQLNQRWMHKTYDPDSPDSVWDQFANEARNQFAEIGFVIDIMWSEIQADGLPGTAAIPQITVIGRTDRHETDHERIQHEVRKGLLDGKEGVIREDGTWAESAKRTQL
ncbi:hypothetical protein KHQ86_gp204 [Gordonia phage Stormageddon]|uniref:Uncharacterized protein n=1 Tax=Gordonia phage Stormageddon TaxID=2656541 RepID=A0A649VRM1_9CAUD|nr:hypothetical protein KHQ86_gp204 [Gordonia phage Stormageddon]QGJ94958.1 hypothetical protein SEA_STORMAGEDDON_96 [Gordonia phage Stormageddon]